MRCLLVLAASAAALAPLVAKRDASSVSRRAFGAAAVAGAFVALPANAKIDVNNAMAREFSAYPGVARRPREAASMASSERPLLRTQVCSPPSGPSSSSAARSSPSETCTQP